MQRTLLVAALGLLAACAPETTAPVRVQALVLNSDGSYKPQEVQLTTISDIIRMEGVAAKIIGGARIRVDSNDPELQGALNLGDGKAITNAMLKSDGRPVTASFIDDNGVLWPADFHTWNIVTAYFNFEKAFDYFLTVGNLRSEELKEPTLYYFPEFILADSNPEPLKDNALFFSPVQAFMVLPFEQLQKTPLAINAGIMAHEYAHIIFNKKVYGGQQFPGPIVGWGSGSSTPGANMIKALDEGLADYHGFGVTCNFSTGCDPKFLRTSFGETETLERDLTAQRCITAPLRQQLQTENVSVFTSQSREYRLGSILASALYRAGESEPGGHKVLQRALVSAYSDKNNMGLAELIEFVGNDQASFNPLSVSAVLINHVPEGPLRRAVCNELIDRLQLPAAEIVGIGKPCPPEAQGSSNCPKI